MKIGKHILLTRLFLYLSLVFWSSNALAQARFYYGSGTYEPEILIEAGVALGFMNSVTDLQGNPMIYQGPFAGVTLQKSNFSTGLYGSFLWKDILGARLEYAYGMVEAYDSLLNTASAPSAIGRYDRNLNFRSPIHEISVIAEFHPFQLFRSYEKEPLRLSPYLFGGLSWFSFYPQAYTANGWVDLPPLRLEGQGFAEYPDREIYATNSFAYPFGIGVRYDLSPKLTIRLELNKRTTFTDYIDDVHEANWVDPTLFAKYLPPDKAALARQLYNRSPKPSLNPPQNTRPRGHPTENDAFWTGVLKIGINLNRSTHGGGAFPGGAKAAAKKLRCPNF